MYKQTKLIIFAVSIFLFSTFSVAYSADMRMDFEVGYNSGTIRPDTNIGGENVSGSIGAGSGPVLGWTLWRDKALVDWLSIGVGVRYRNNNTNLQVGNYSGEINIHAYDILSKLAIRENKGIYHPYIGVGFGVTRLTTDFDSEYTTGPTVEIFAGFDYDINKNFYIGIETYYARTFADAYGAKFYFDSLGSTVKTGFKF